MAESGTLRNSLARAAELLDQFRADAMALEGMEKSVQAIADVFRRRGRVFACGNGGSMADAIHFAEEFSGRFIADREPYPALALSDPAHLTCVANDYGFDQVFARQVTALGHEGDLLLLLSTSGNSPNLLRAAEAARGRKVQVLGFLGRGGGEVRALCDIAVIAPGEESARIQELHMLALHAIIEAVEIEMCR